jgi:hypothetical protein
VDDVVWVALSEAMQKGRALERAEFLLVKRRPNKVEADNELAREWESQIGVHALEVLLGGAYLAFQQEHKVDVECELEGEGVSEVASFDMTRRGGLKHQANGWLATIMSSQNIVVAQFVVKSAHMEHLRALFTETGARSNVTPKVLAVDDASGSMESPRNQFFKQTLGISQTINDYMHIQHRLQLLLNNAAGIRFYIACSKLTNALYTVDRLDMQDIDRGLQNGTIARKFTYKDVDGNHKTWQVKLGEKLEVQQIEKLKGTGLYLKIFTRSQNLRRYPVGLTQARQNLEVWESEVLCEEVKIPASYVNSKAGSREYVLGQLAAPLYGLVVPTFTYAVVVGSVKVIVPGSDIDVTCHLGCPALSKCVDEQVKKWTFMSVGESGYIEGVSMWRRMTNKNKNGLNVFVSKMGTNRNETYHSVVLDFNKGDNLTKEKSVSRTREGNCRWNTKRRREWEAEERRRAQAEWEAAGAGEAAAAKQQRRGRAVWRVQEAEEGASGDEDSGGGKEEKEKGRPGDYKGHFDWWVVEQLNRSAGVTRTGLPYPSFERPALTTPSGGSTCTMKIASFIKGKQVQGKKRSVEVSSEPALAQTGSNLVHGSAAQYQLLLPEMVGRSSSSAGGGSSGSRCCSGSGSGSSSGGSSSGGSGSCSGSGSSSSGSSSSSSGSGSSSRGNSSSGGGSGSSSGGSSGSGGGSSSGTSKKKYTCRGRNMKDCPEHVKVQCRCPDATKRCKGRRFHNKPTAAGGQCVVYQWIYFLGPYEGDRGGSGTGTGS